MTTTTKLPLQGCVVKAMFHTRTERGMQLIGAESRCIARGELHELVSTDQQGLRAGDRVDRVGFLGFIEAKSAAVVERGDRFVVDGACWGTVVGFDDCHYPNHYNILIATESLLTAAQLPAFGPGTRVSFEEPQ